MKLLHTMIRVSDIDKSLKFYQEILGLKICKILELEKAKATLYYLTDEDGNYEIELTYNHEPPSGGYQMGTAFGHFAVNTENMNEFTKHLHSKDYDYTRPPFKIDGGSTIAFINDPDGYQIEIIENRK